ncbi:MAG: response regulator [Desulfobacterales bacterium]|nr:response regulator [Desulfobacterales bacterium]
MHDLSQIGYISTNTVIFARSVIQSLKDMVGISFMINKASFREAPFSPPFKMIAYIPFTGTIQGDYIISMDEIAAAKLSGVYKEGMSGNEILKMREDYGGFIKELLNLAAARSILGLEQSFGNLTYTPATLVYGEIEFPNVMSGNIRIESNKCKIQCGFSLNLAKLKIGRKLEETLKDLEKRKIEATEAQKDLENILQKLPTGVVAINSACKVLPGHGLSTASVLGYDPGEKIEGTDLSVLLGLAPDDSHNLTKWINLVFSAYDSFSFEKLLLLCEDEFANQHDKILRLDWVPVVNNKTGTLEKLQVIIEDITEKHRLEAEIQEKEKLKKQLRQVQKMEAIGTMAGGIAHDFNNIIQIVLGNAELSLFDAPKKGKIKERLTNIIGVCNRARNMVKQLLSFSRQTEQDRKPVQVEPVIKETLKLIRASLPSTIEIRQNIRTTSSVILADPTQIHQVLMNLCINAGHAMEDKGGELKVSLDSLTFDDNAAAKKLGLSQGDYVRLTVNDTGCGMDHEIIEKIFEPFFTTKEQGKGTGIGLSVVHGIVKNHKGAVKVNSEPGKGTTFNVFLPKADHEAEVTQADKSKPVPRGTGRILFIDDEEYITEMASDILSGLGYKVIAHTSSMKALDIFSARPDMFDLVITDQTMPKISGTELAEKLIGIRPDIPIILCTGFSKSAVLKKAKTIGVRELIAKPFTMNEIACLISRVLNNKSCDL